MDNTFSDILKEFLINNNLTQTAFAKTVGIKQSQVSEGVATGDCIRTRQNAAISALFVKFSLEVRQVRLRSPLPKIIKNIGVLVVDKARPSSNAITCG